jgi:hypothetical protein
MAGARGVGPGFLCTEPPPVCLKGQASRRLDFDAMPSLRHRSETLCSPLRPSSTMRIFSSGENFLRVRRRMSRTAASVDCLLCLVMKHSSGSFGPRQMSLSLGPLNVRVLLTGYS